MSTPINATDIPTLVDLLQRWSDAYDLLMPPGVQRRPGMQQLITNTRDLLGRWVPPDPPPSRP